MVMIYRWTWLVLALAACDHGGTAAIDAADGETVLSCAQLTEALRARLAATSRGCTQAADCEVAGSTIDPVFGGPTCNCGYYFAPSCGGEVVNRAAWAADTVAAELAMQWRTRCRTPGSGAAMTCDCAPGPVSCVAQTCTVGVFNCFADAGI